jgi:hypothetical protein
LANIALDSGVTNASLLDCVQLHCRLVEAVHREMCEAASRAN